VESQLGYSRSSAPQIWGGGYNNQGYIYQILMWTGPDYDIRQYRDYWVTPHEKQNWLYSAWYDNPYLIAYEKLFGQEENKLHAAHNELQYSEKFKIHFRLVSIFTRMKTSEKSGRSILNRGLRQRSILVWCGKVYGMNQRWGIESQQCPLLSLINRSENLISTS
jgi:hypothetical protein